MPVGVYVGMDRTVVLPRAPPRFRIEGLGFRVSGLVRRVQDFKGVGLGFRVHGLGGLEPHRSGHSCPLACEGQAPLALLVLTSGFSHPDTLTTKVTWFRVDSLVLVIWGLEIMV